MYVDAKEWQGQAEWDAKAAWSNFKDSVQIHLSNYYSNCRRAVVNTNGLNVRSGGGVGFGVVEVLKKGDPVIVYSQANESWVSIGENKFVNTRFLS